MFIQKLIIKAFFRDRDVAAQLANSIRNQTIAMLFANAVENMDKKKWR